MGCAVTMDVEAEAAVLWPALRERKERPGMSSTLEEGRCGKVVELVRWDK